MSSRIHQERWIPPYGVDEESVNTEEMFRDWESRPRTPSLEKMPRLVPPMGTKEEPTKVGLDETVEILAKVLEADTGDPDLTALSAAIKTKLGFQVGRSCQLLCPLGSSY